MIHAIIEFRGAIGERICAPLSDCVRRLPVAIFDHKLHAFECGNLFASMPPKLFKLIFIAAG